jgi:hypothetical protein
MMKNQKANGKNQRAKICALPAGLDGTQKKYF